MNSYLEFLHSRQKLQELSSREIATVREIAKIETIMIKNNFRNSKRRTRI